ncbi:MAG TPA: methionine synthase [Anaerolineae bacterium]
MTAFEPACLAAGLGSLPLTDARAACSFVLRYFPAIPMWPQLPKLTFRENMYVQFSEGLPGANVIGDRLYVDMDHVEQDLERLYVAYLGDDSAGVGAVGRAYAEGLAMFLSLKPALAGAVAVKGQVTGPISLGLQVTDWKRRPILYDEIMADALSRLLRLKAAWQETQLRALCPRTLMFVDEPFLSAFGSAHVSLSRDQVLCSLEEVFAGIQGLKGLHCCGNTDWGMLLDTSADVISLDAYDYATPFALYANEIRAFLRRGGAIAWGIVPNDGGRLAVETTESLTERLLAAMDLLVQKGISRDDLLNRSLITSSCGLGTLSVADATRACELTDAVSEQMRALAGSDR